MENFIDYAVKMVQLCDENDYEGLDEFLIQAETFFISRLEYEKLIRLYIALHEYLQRGGNTEALFKYLDRFVHVYEEYTLDVLKNHYYSTKAFIEHLLGNEREVIKYLNKAFDENERENNIIAKGAILNNLAYTYFLLEDYDVSLKYSLESEKLIEEYQLTGTYIHYKIELNFAKLYIKNKQLDKAKMYLDMAIENDEFKSSIIERIDYYATFAEYEASVGMVTEAIDHYKIAIQYAEENNMYLEQRSYYSGIATILYENKFFEEYNYYTNKYKQLIHENEEKNKHAIETNKPIPKIKSNLVAYLRTKLISINKSTQLDELTECLKSEYMITLVSKLKIRPKSKKLQFGLYLKLDQLQPILDQYGQIYTEKMVYEFSKLIKKELDHVIIGRIRFNEFLVVFNEVSKDEIEQKIGSIKQACKNEKVYIQKKSYSLEMIGSWIELNSYIAGENTSMIDFENLCTLLRSDASKEIFKLM